MRAQISLSFIGDYRWTNTVDPDRVGAARFQNLRAPMSALTNVLVVVAPAISGTFLTPVGK
jgi:hypothetical protein